MNQTFSLSPSQREAACHFTGPCEVIAGPGSGKTAVLVRRILYLIRDRHISPASVLVLTFSKAAALEMQTRFLKSCGGAYPEVAFGTFHSVFYNILRLSSPRPLKVIDDRTRRNFLKSILISFYPDPSRRPEVPELESVISRYKNTRCIPQFPGFKKLYREYETFLSENGYVDFDGMLTKCLALLKTRKDVLSKWQERFHFILVDEFQDINPVQYEAVRLLCGDRKNLFVVGDDDQSIYGFRGSDPSIMQHFGQDFPGTKKIFLSENFRCSGAVVLCAGRIISENTGRIKKNIRAVRPRGNAVIIRSFVTGAEENLELCRIFSKMNEEEQAGCAVIYRTHQQSMGLRYEMDRVGIPYIGKKKSGSRAQEEILGDVCAYFRAAYSFGISGADRADIYRIMNRPQRLFPRDICRRQKVFPEDLLCEAKRRPGIQSGLIRFTQDLRFLSEVNPGYAMRYLMRAMGYAEYAVEQYRKNEGDIMAFIGSLISDSAPLRDEKQLERMLSMRLKGLYSAQNENTGCKEGVRILTMHACKGLQFQKVFLPDLNEGVIPTRRADSGAALEEERRLLYVAVTRAKEELFLMYIGGASENPRRPTRFLRALGVKAYS